jgi:hypothetical protein
MMQQPGGPAEFHPHPIIPLDVHYPNRYAHVAALLTSSVLFPGGPVDYQSFEVPTPPAVLSPPPPRQGRASGLPTRRPMAAVDRRGALRPGTIDPAHTERAAMRDKDLAQRILVGICDTDNTAALNQLATGIVPERFADSPQLARWMVSRAVRLVDQRGYMPRHEAAVAERPAETPEGEYAFVYSRAANGRRELLMTSWDEPSPVGYEGRHQDGMPVNQAIGRVTVEAMAETVAT